VFSFVLLWVGLGLGGSGGGGVISFLVFAWVLVVVVMVLVSLRLFAWVWWVGGDVWCLWSDGVGWGCHGEEAVRRWPRCREISEDGWRLRE
jgi:hypothetical protein